MQADRQCTAGQIGPRRCEATTGWIGGALVGNRIAVGAGVSVGAGTKTELQADSASTDRTSIAIRAEVCFMFVLPFFPLKNLRSAVTVL
jgi:hypothetical protein